MVSFPQTANFTTGYRVGAPQAKLQYFREKLT
jgi:hypothetical protein